MPDIPHPTAKSVVAATPAAAMTSRVVADEDDETDEGHYDVIPRQSSVEAGPVHSLSHNNHNHNPYERVASLPGTEDAESDSTYAPVGSETYAGVRDLPASILALQDPDLDPDPSYAGIEDGGAPSAADQERLHRGQGHNYESVEATYSQVLDRSRRNGAAQEGAVLPGGDAAVVMVTPVLGGAYDMIDGGELNTFP